jgi:LysM repeat protein
MQKSFKFIVAVGVFICAFGTLVAQARPTYKDVLLNGKPAKLNLATGEFILVNGNTLDTINAVDFKTKDAPIKSNGAAKPSEVKPVLKQPLPAADNTTTYHIVKTGETLFGISKQYGATMQQLKQANNLETTLINIGQRLRVNNFDATQQASGNTSSYKVLKGDTLYSIAKKNNTTVSAIKKLNNLKNNTILVGQTLRLR